MWRAGANRPHPSSPRSGHTVSPGSHHGGRGVWSEGRDCCSLVVMQPRSETIDLRAFTLGPLVAARRGRGVRMSGVGARALLVYPVLRRDTVVTADRLIGGLRDGSPPPSTAATSHTRVSGSREALVGDGPVLTRVPGHRSVPTAHGINAVVLGQHAGRARAADRPGSGVTADAGTAPGILVVAVLAAATISGLVLAAPSDAVPSQTLVLRTAAFDVGVLVLPFHRWRAARPAAEVAA